MNLGILCVGGGSPAPASFRAAGAARTLNLVWAESTDGLCDVPHTVGFGASGVSAGACERGAGAGVDSYVEGVLS